MYLRLLVSCLAAILTFSVVEQPAQAQPTAGIADGMEDGARKAKSPRASKPVSIQSGCVILNGRYVEPPYEIAAAPEGATINGHVIAEALFHGPRHRSDVPTAASFTQRLEKRLLDDALLLGWDNVGFGFLNEDRALGMLGILSTEQSDNKKSQHLAQLNITWIDPESWPDLLDTVDLPAEFLARQMANDSIPAAGVGVSVHQADVYRPYLRARFVQYVITIGGMAVTVFALGTVLSLRLPTERHRWREVNPSPDGTRIVGRCVALLIVLAVMDLFCTTYSAQASSFWELNPVGNAALGTPFMLGCFKIGATLLSCTILFGLRRYHGAQQAAWWLATFCTVLAMRWVTFNSMFLT